VAYLKLAGEKPDVETVKENLRKKLPEYMIPSFFVKVEKIAITTSGKVDRKSLPAINYQELVSYREQIEKTKLCKSILRIWQHTFNKEDITVHDSFFWLGGNSLLATEIASRISSTLNIAVEQRAVCDYQTIFEMAGYLETRKALQAL
jgi:non-ribosomal peptide synthetase component E (peptide arylation enzyme)